MVFSSTVFLFLFLPVVLIVYYNPIFKGRGFRNVFLLFSSLGFYAWGEPVCVFLMMVSIVITWFFGLKISAASEAKAKKRRLTIGIVYQLSMLFLFKYLTFIAQQLGLLLNQDFSVILGMSGSIYLLYQ